MMRAPCWPLWPVTASRTTAGDEREEPQGTAPRAYLILGTHANGDAAADGLAVVSLKLRDGGALCEVTMVSSMATVHSSSHYVQRSSSPHCHCIRHCTRGDVLRPEAHRAGYLVRWPLWWRGHPIHRLLKNCLTTHQLDIDLYTEFLGDRNMREAQRGDKEHCTSTTNIVHLYADTPGSPPHAPP